MSIILRDYYLPCADGDMPIISLTWAGFHTNNVVLEKEGWLSKIGYNKYVKNYTVRFYHPKLFMTFALRVLSLLDLSGKTFEVDFMSIGGQRNRRPKKRDIPCLLPSDIPELLEAIVRLQRPVREEQIQKTTLPNAEVFDFANYIEKQNV